MLGFIGIWHVSSSTQLDLSDNDRISLIIAIITASGGLTSAAFVVFSYWQTSEAHVDAQRPQLLIHVQSRFEEGTNFPLSIIEYRNITRNKFDDLTIHVMIAVDGQEYSLDGLFRHKMTMIGLDQRSRFFHPYVEVSKLGPDMQKLANAGKNIKLNIGYEHTFYGSRNVVDAQRYEWNAQKQLWEIC